MFYRLFSRSQPAVTWRDLTRQELIAVLQRPGCALCRLAQQKNPRYVETWLDNAVIDVEQRDTWRHAKGFCSWHAWMATHLPQSSSSLAILYDDVLGHEIQYLAALTAASLALRQRQWPPGRRLAKRVRHWLRTWHQVCPVCRLWQQQEQLCMTVLLTDWHEPTLTTAFAQSSGLCLPHIARLMAHGANHVHLPAFLAVQQERLQALQAELREFIRKQDYRFAHEPFGSEADAWQRVVALFVGTYGGCHTMPQPPTDDS
ncbi:hypothetical protein NKDENANG_01333 [Candidatus Entotheonellaceae bacterium PAL068K]